MRRPTVGWISANVWHSSQRHEVAKRFVSCSMKINLMNSRRRHERFRRSFRSLSAPETALRLITNENTHASRGVEANRLSRVHRISRKDLYELIWSEPITVLARRFGILDVGLAKVWSPIGHSRTAAGLLGEDCCRRVYPAPRFAETSRSWFQGHHISNQPRSQIRRRRRATDTPAHRKFSGTGYRRVHTAASVGETRLLGRRSSKIFRTQGRHDDQGLSMALSRRSPNG
jgi:hypothetical protein